MRHHTGTFVAAGMSFLGTSTNSSRNVVQQWTEAARQAHQATLDVWQASVHAGDRLPAPSALSFLSRPIATPCRLE
jgi:hypothetical protein